MEAPRVGTERVGAERVGAGRARPQMAALARFVLFMFVHVMDLRTYATEHYCVCLNPLHRACKTSLPGARIDARVAVAQRAALQRFVAAVGGRGCPADAPHSVEEQAHRHPWAVCADGSVHVRCALCGAIRTLRTEDYHHNTAQLFADNGVPTTPWGRLWAARTWCCADDARGLRCSQVGPSLYAQALGDATSRWLHHTGYYAPQGTRADTSCVLCWKLHVVFAAAAAGHSYVCQQNNHRHNRTTSTHSAATWQSTHST